MAISAKCIRYPFKSSVKIPYILLKINQFATNLPREIGFVLQPMSYRHAEPAVLDSLGSLGSHEKCILL